MFSVLFLQVTRQRRRAQLQITDAVYDTIRIYGNVEMDLYHCIGSHADAAGPSGQEEPLYDEAYAEAGPSGQSQNAPRGDEYQNAPRGDEYQNVPSSDEYQGIDVQDIAVYNSHVSQEATVTIKTGRVKLTGEKHWSPIEIHYKKKAQNDS